MNGLEIYPEILSKESCEKIIAGFKKDTINKEEKLLFDVVLIKYLRTYIVLLKNDKFSFYTEIISPALYVCCDNIKRDYPFLIDQV